MGVARAIDKARRSAVRAASAVGMSCLFYVLGSAGEISPLMQSSRPFVVGVGIHPYEVAQGATPLVNLAASLGFNSLRIDLPWKDVERTRGDYEIPPLWDKLVDDAKARDIEPLLILDYGNPLYGRGTRPVSDATIVAFRDYVEAVARHFGSRVRYYELWNEWDRGTAHRGEGSAQAYVRLARSVYSALKQASPNSVLLVGAITPQGLGNGYLSVLLRSGVMEYGDGLSIHPYVYQENGSAQRWARWVAAIEETAMHETGDTVPLYVTEVGWPTFIGSGGVSADEQANDAVRTFLLARSMRYVRGLWWYELRDRSRNSFARNANFGVCDSQYRPKAAGRALKAILGLVKTARFRARLTTGAGRVDGLVFSTSTGVSVAAIWASKATLARRVRLVSDGPLLAVQDLNDGKGESSASACELSGRSASCSTKLLERVPVELFQSVRDARFELLVEH